MSGWIVSFSTYAYQEDVDMLFRLLPTSFGSTNAVRKFLKKLVLKAPPPSLHDLHSVSKYSLDNYRDERTHSIQNESFHSISLGRVEED